ncbi:MAG: hypothetical protein RIS43_796 [Actinomycetota bacterium]|jgi:uncharacterized protein (TIGR02611 family)
MSEKEHHLSDHERLEDKIEHVAEEIVEDVEGAMEATLPMHLRLQSWARRRPATHAVWRAAVLILGIATMVLGLLLSLPGIPGPGILIFFFGLVILSSEFAWAHRVREPLEKFFAKIGAKFKEIFRRK